MIEERVAADLPYRRRILTVYLAAAVAGSAALVLLVPAVLAWLGRLGLPTAIVAVEWLLIALLLIFIGPAIYLAVVGRRILRHGCVPYPGMRVIRDTVVLRGARARLRGKVLIYLGSFAVAMALAGAFGTYIVMERFRNDPAFMGLLLPE